jgi:hypothetical protein
MNGDSQTKLLRVRNMQRGDTNLAGMGYGADCSSLEQQPHAMAAPPDAGERWQIHCPQHAVDGWRHIHNSYTIQPAPSLPLQLRTAIPNYLHTHRKHQTANNHTITSNPKSKTSCSETSVRHTSSTFCAFFKPSRS